MEQVEYKWRNVYGVELRYPVNNLARLVCQLAGTKTLTDGAVATLSEYGIRVYEQHS
jgi:hypothetical protein